jgi:alpha-L-rhamnosidase
MKEMPSSQFDQSREFLQRVFLPGLLECCTEQVKLPVMTNPLSFEKGTVQIDNKAGGMILILALIQLMMVVSTGTSSAQTIRPVVLQCEYRVDPVGIDIQNPSLSWQLETTSEGLRNQKQTGYQILVASSPEVLSLDKGDLWNSEMVQSDQSIHVMYAGKPLKSLDRCYWKVRVQDGDGALSGWSAPARWEMGLLSRVDWKGNWIGSGERKEQKSLGQIYGYCSGGAATPDEIKWVQVDLGEARALDKVMLHPALPSKYPDGQRTVSNPGFGFPVRFRVDISMDPDFNRYTTILDKTDSDFRNPRFDAVAVHCSGKKARYVRVTATRLWNSGHGDDPFYFALGELQVISEDEVISLNSSVQAFDSAEDWGWGKCHLTDGLNLVDEVQRGHEAVLLRKETEIPTEIWNARAFISGLGYYELNINGEKVGDHKLDPGFTDYSKRVLYQAYDVTASLKRGTNCIGIMLGTGWYDQTTPDAWGFHEAPWVAPPKVLLNILIEYADGTTDVLASDETWKFSTGEIVFNSVRSGEIHDARLRKDGWDMPGYKDDAWESAVVVRAPAGKLESQSSPPIRATKEITSVSISEPLPGVYVFDLGVNIAGWARLKIKGNEGDTVSLFFNEHLNPDGTVRYGAHAWWHYGPYQTDQYICDGSGIEIFEPRFTYHGFQYVEVKGLKNKPVLEDLTGIWVHTDPDRVGEFECSNQDINKVQELIIRTQLNNLHSIPTDCPHREKIGWLGDGLVTEEEAIYNFDMATFYIKWFRDMMDAQETNGHVPPIVPNPGWDWATSLKNPENVIPVFSDPWWGGALILTPMNLYTYYGDARYIAEGYDAMGAYMDWIAMMSEDGIFKAIMGDWVEPASFSEEEKTSREQIGTATYFMFARTMSEYARLLDKPRDASRYSNLAGTIRDTYNAKFFNEASGSYAGDKQLSQVMPLLFGIVPDGREKLVMEKLIDLIVNKNRGHLDTGFTGTPLLFKLLTQKGYAELAYTIATQEDHPGWFYMLRHGATTIWEVWDAIAQIHHSRNHPAFGSIGAWYYQSLAGIQPDPAGPGFKKIIINPEVPGDLTWARASYTSMHGKISSDWKRENGTFILNVEVPVNTKATVYVPAVALSSILEGNVAVENAEQVSYIKTEMNKYVFEVGSGRYQFIADYPK